ncbi:Rab family GTPase [Nonlabens sp.]|jgi:GTPase SAR1 family protein|uniref:Rab family GTPase n=1 Tax=Nonlabens sp. TaxID=1888209 RepID=UPI0039E5FDD2
MTSKKIVILGSFEVVKTSLTRRFVEHTFSEDYHVAIDIPSLKEAVKIKANILNLIIWGTEGTDNMEETRKAYLLGSQGFVSKTDVIRPKTDPNHIKHKDYLKTHFGNVPIITIGNRSNLLPKGSLSKKNEIFRHAPQC